MLEIALTKLRPQRFTIPTDMITHRGFPPHLYQHYLLCRIRPTCYPSRPRDLRSNTYHMYHSIYADLQLLEKASEP